MKSDLLPLNVYSTNNHKVDHNKRFLKMVRINIMFNDGGG